MPFQNDQFVRNQNFRRDRELGPPNDTISADRVDDEFDNVTAGLTSLKAVQDALPGEIADDYATKTALDLKFDKAGGTITGPVTMGGKPGASKGVVTGGTVVWDFNDGVVQDITLAGNVTFDFANLPARGGPLQINITYQSGALTVAGTTWWEQGGAEKTNSLAQLGVQFRTGRPYRMVVEMVAGLRAGILQ